MRIQVIYDFEKHFLLWIITNSLKLKSSVLPAWVNDIAQCTARDED
jgi:hypothetical protein